MIIVEVGKIGRGQEGVGEKLGDAFRGSPFLPADPHRLHAPTSSNALAKSKDALFLVFLLLYSCTIVHVLVRVLFGRSAISYLILVLNLVDSTGDVWF
jgi:hypothetical protein